MHNVIVHVTEPHLVGGRYCCSSVYTAIKICRKEECGEELHLVLL